MNDVIPPPASSGQAVTPEAVLHDIDAWIDNPALASLLDAFGARVPAGSTAERLDHLDAFSAEHWDFRGGRERNLAAAREFPAELQERILFGAELLGMRGPIPPRRNHYTHVLLLGGLVRACLLRPRYAAQLIDAGLDTKSVAALTAYRPLGGDEPELAAAAGLPADLANEMEAMQAGLVAAFGLDEHSAVDFRLGNGEGFGTAFTRTWQRGDLQAQLVVAPSPEPAKRRANSADTYVYWADSCARLQPGDSVLLVTSTIYVPAQHCDAVRVLAMPRGCSVETVGFDVSSATLGPLRQRFTPANYLQEVRSAIRSVRALHAVAAAM